MQGINDMISVKDFSTVKHITPERELLIAVLDRAVLDFCGREGELHLRAKEWIFGEDEIDSDHSFSFNVICEHLGLNPSALRERILTLKIPKNVSQAHRWLRSKVQKDKSRMHELSMN
jgi:hypothetical protein